MNNFSDYLEENAIEMDKNINREINRVINDVEVPLLEEEFATWMTTEQNHPESTKINYVRWIRLADQVFIDPDNDIWAKLKEAWDKVDSRKAKTLSDEYDKQMQSLKAAAQERNNQDMAKEIGNWVSSFRKYSKFFNEQIEKAEAQRKASIERARLTSRHLFFDFKFILWCIQDGLDERTAESYVSYLKRANREIFCKSGQDKFHVSLPRLVKDKDKVQIEKLFTELNTLLTERINNGDESEMPIDSLRNCRSALNKYAEFIKSIIDAK